MANLTSKQMNQQMVNEFLSLDIQNIKNARIIYKKYCDLDKKHHGGNLLLPHVILAYKGQKLYTEEFRKTKEYNDIIRLIGHKDVKSVNWIFNSKI